MVQMNPAWYTEIIRDDEYMTRSDFLVVKHHRRHLFRRRFLSRALAEHIKKQRLLQEEIEQLDNLQQSGQTIDAEFSERLKWSLAEGILKDDLKTVDEDALLGTCGQLMVMWIRSQFYGSQIIYSSPKLLTDSSTDKGIDYFEILGDPSDANSLRFIIWEIKATDGKISSRTDEIYQMHKKRTPRLIRGLQVQLSSEYPEDTIMGQFVRHLLEHWQSNTSAKCIGGAVVYDTTQNPGNVFTTFYTQFPFLYSAKNRQVILIEIPKFKKIRKNLWNHLKTQIY
jgi:hypothetical protein